MNITDFIPVGHENAVSRKYLSIITGLSDRRIREAISKARHETPIINLQEGDGYYIPDKDDPVDMAELDHYVNQETSRLKSIGWSLKAARDFNKEAS